MSKKKRVNSRQKGKVGERSAVNYLKSIGFSDARRTQQYSGVNNDFDVECPDSLPNVGIEVKYGYPQGAFDLGTVLWRDAIDTAASHAVPGTSWALLWRPARVKRWRLTYEGAYGLCTSVGDERIRNVLSILNRECK